MMGQQGRQVVALVILLTSLVGVACARRGGGGEPSEGPRAAPDLAGDVEPGRGVAAFAAVRRPAPREYIAVVDLKDIHFDFDRAEIRPDAARVLDFNAEWLRRHPQYLLLIEGHADERGTSEYNLALGERRARNAMNYLVSRGVAGDRVTVISYGEERPLCRAATEACWAENRRAHFAVRAP
jgi:peptidoglycan-associated lipoprotein